MMGAVFGSVIVPFGKPMYDKYLKDWHHNLHPSSMFERYGLAIRKFGISFETDAGRMPTKNRSLCFPNWTRFDGKGSAKDELE